MPLYRAENFHLIAHQQREKVVKFRSVSDTSARLRFQQMRESDKTIQEGVLVKVKGKVRIDEYVGYI